LSFVENITCEKSGIRFANPEQSQSQGFFDIYGTLEDLKYWNECQELIKKLPDNIKVKYMGIVKPDMVVPVFSFYDLFLFPSGGENYGHVIAESLTAERCPHKRQNSLKNLQKDNIGWDFSLDQRDHLLK